MRYVPKELNYNPNISPTSPLKELFFLLSILFLTILGIYIILGAMVNIIVPKIPQSMEEKIGRLYTQFLRENFKETNNKAKEQIQNLLDDLVKKIPSSERYKVHIIENEKTNALALPGNNIIIFTGLLKKINSENELAFVLAHELGHFVHRDHLKALGRSLVLFFLSSLLLGEDNTVTDFFRNSLLKTEMKFSQIQEKKADLFALDLLNKKYGHVAGAIKFLEKIPGKNVPKLFYFFATHPHPEQRIKTLKKAIKIKGYKIGKETPLTFSFPKSEM